MKRKTIVEKIIEFVKDEHYEEYYVGITANPEKRLESEHKVDMNKDHRDSYIFKKAKSAKSARKAECQLLEKGFKGGSGGGKKNAKYVYAYRITSTTSQ